MGILTTTMSEALHIPTGDEVAALDPGTRFEIAAAMLNGLDAGLRTNMLANLLGELAPGRLPLAVFKEFCRLAVGSAVEVVPIRDQGRGPEIWLEQRSHDDPWWPDKWVLPGVRILPTDEHDTANSLGGPVARLFKHELPGIRQAGELSLLPPQFRNDGRGEEVATQFWVPVETGGEPYPGRFFSLNELRRNPPDALHEGWLTINRAVAAYKTSGALEATAAG